MDNLQTLVRRDFLPRGEGCVTRCPLVLTLRNTRGLGGSEGGGDEVVTFYADAGGRNPQRVMANPAWDDVRREIEDRTRSKAGGNANIVDDPIVMRIDSPNVIDLELVDLPGLTRNPRGVSKICCILMLLLCDLSHL